MDYLRRRLTVQAAGMAAGLLSLPQPADFLSERLIATLTRQHSSSIDSGTLQYLHQRTDHYWEQR
ncbi:MAG: hypothetical protein ACRDHW_14485, partial [Ktedonobacteraceae bacterium]